MACKRYWDRRRRSTADPPPLHSRCPVSRLRHVPRNKLSAGPTPENENFKTLRLRHALSPCGCPGGSMRGICGISSPTRSCAIAPEQTAIRCALRTCDPPAAQPRKSLPASAFRLIARSRRTVVSRIVVYDVRWRKRSPFKSYRAANSRHRGAVSAISERGATSRRRKNAVAARNFKAPEALFLFCHVHRLCCLGLSCLRSGEPDSPPFPRRFQPSCRRGGHRGGFALSPIRAAFSDGVRRVVETGSEVGQLHFRPSAGSVSRPCRETPQPDERVIYRGDMGLV